MSDYGNDFIVLTDEEGNEVEFEHIDTIEVGDETYMAFIPAEFALEEEAEVVILKVIEEDGEENLISIDDEVELTAVYDILMKRIEEMEEIDE